MKKIFFFSCVIFLCQFLTAQKPASSDDKKKKKTETSLRAIVGLNYANVSGESDSYNEGIWGPTVGLGVNVLNFTDALRLRAEALYSMQGSKYEDYVSGKVILSYIIIPIYAYWMAMSGIYASLGLQPGILLTAQDKYSGNTYDYTDQTSRFDLGVPIGVGYEKNKFGIGVRVTPGLLNVNKDDPAKDHNFVASLMASYKL